MWPAPSESVIYDLLISYVKFVFDNIVLVISLSEELLFRVMHIVFIIFEEENAHYK